MDTIEQKYRQKYIQTAVVFCPTSRFTFFIGTVLPASVPAPSVVNNPCPLYLSPSSLLPWQSNFHHCSQLRTIMQHMSQPPLLCIPQCVHKFPSCFNCFCAPSKISLTCDAKSVFQNASIFLRHFFAVSMSHFHTMILGPTPYKCFDYAFFSAEG